MYLRCFFLGCEWGEGTPTEIGGEELVCQRCSRCGAHRYLQLYEQRSRS
ncbi:PSPA7_2676 family Cys-rich small protein [Zestomonas insulae]|nr:PSPA7_2676 family Cys-rich small protein [Pseudomonas insulae]